MRPDGVRIEHRGELMDLLCESMLQLLPQCRLYEGSNIVIRHRRYIIVSTKESAIANDVKVTISELDRIVEPSYSLTYICHEQCKKVINFHLFT